MERKKQKFSKRLKSVKMNFDKLRISFLFVSLSPSFPISFPLFLSLLFSFGPFSAPFVVVLCRKCLVQRMFSILSILIFCILMGIFKWKCPLTQNLLEECYSNEKITLGCSYEEIRCFIEDDERYRKLLDTRHLSSIDVPPHVTLPSSMYVLKRNWVEMFMHFGVLKCSSVCVSVLRTERERERCEGKRSSYVCICSRL